MSGTDEIKLKDLINHLGDKKVLPNNQSGNSVSWAGGQAGVLVYQPFSQEYAVKSVDGLTTLKTFSKEETKSVLDSQGISPEALGHSANISANLGTIPTDFTKSTDSRDGAKPSQPRDATGPTGLQGPVPGGESTEPKGLQGPVSSAVATVVADQTAPVGVNAGMVTGPWNSYAKSSGSDNVINSGKMSTDFKALANDKSDQTTSPTPKDTFEHVAGWFGGGGGGNAPAKPAETTDRTAGIVPPEVVSLPGYKPGYGIVSINDGDSERIIGYENKKGDQITRTDSGAIVQLPYGQKNPYLVQAAPADAQPADTNVRDANPATKLQGLNPKFGNLPLGTSSMAYPSGQSDFSSIPHDFTKPAITAPSEDTFARTSLPSTPATSSSSGGTLSQFPTMDYAKNMGIYSNPNSSGVDHVERTKDGKSTLTYMNSGAIVQKADNSATSFTVKKADPAHEATKVTTAQGPAYTGPEIVDPFARDYETGPAPLGTKTGGYTYTTKNGVADWYSNVDDLGGTGVANPGTKPDTTLPTTPTAPADNKLPSSSATAASDPSFGGVFNNPVVIQPTNPALGTKTGGYTYTTKNGVADWYSNVDDLGGTGVANPGTKPDTTLPVQAPAPSSAPVAVGGAIPFVPTPIATPAPASSWVDNIKSAATAQAEAADKHRKEQAAASAAAEERRKQETANALTVAVNRRAENARQAAASAAAEDQRKQQAALAASVAVAQKEQNELNALSAAKSITAIPGVPAAPEIKALPSFMTETANTPEIKQVGNKFTYGHGQME